MRAQAGDGDYVAADALLFANASEAHSYAELTAHAACRFPPIEVKASSGTPQTRNLASVDFAAFTTYIALVTRGALVYRIAEVRAQTRATRPSIFQLGPGVNRVNRLVCKLSDAHCRRF